MGEYSIDSESLVPGLQVSVRLQCADLPASWGAHGKVEATVSVTNIDNTLRRSGPDSSLCVPLGGPSRLGIPWGQCETPFWVVSCLERCREEPEWESRDGRRETRVGRGTTQTGEGSDQGGDREDGRGREDGGRVGPTRKGSRRVWSLSRKSVNKRQGHGQKFYLDFYEEGRSCTTPARPPATDTLYGPRPGPWVCLSPYRGHGRSRD